MSVFQSFRRCNPSTLSHLSTLFQFIPARRLLSSESRYQKIVVTLMLTNLSPTSVWWWRIAKRLPLKHAMTCASNNDSVLLASGRFRMQYSLNFKVDEDVYPLVASNGLTVHHHAFIWPHFTDLWHYPLSSCWFWLSSVYSGVWLHSLDGKFFACWSLSLYDHCVRIWDA